MSLPRSNATESTQRPAETRTQPPGSESARKPRRLVWAVLMTLPLALALSFIGGFVWFACSVPSEEVALQSDADGIVVLTGGASRITDAIELLAAGRGKRLLITGVHPTTSSREIARVVPRYQRMLGCCVDLDHSAVNTLGNAAETRRWAKNLGFQSLIVVTSSYHMPRSMSELARQLPDVRLIAFPVVTDKMRAEPWWTNLPTAKLLFSEYLKYMFAQVRMRLEPAPETTDVARARGNSRS